MLTTARLILRQWRNDDLEQLAAINADPRVADWLGGPRNVAESAATLERWREEIARLGHGFWALERRSDARLIGAAGIRPVYASIPAQGMELAWRLAFDAWGNGYATEAAQAALGFGFDHLKLDEVLALTAASNLRSQAVMRRLGMTHDPRRDFDHPSLPEHDPLRRHVVFARRAA